MESRWRARRGARHIDPFAAVAHLDAAGVGAVVAEDHLEDGGLARPRGPVEHGAFPGARLERALLASLGAYAVMSLGARVLSTLGVLAPAAVGSPSSALAFVIGTACAVLAFLLPSGRKSRSKRA